MSSVVFLLQLQELRNCNCLTEEIHNQGQCTEMSRRYLNTANGTTDVMVNTWDDRNYNFPLSTHQEAFAFNQLLRKVPLQMELHLRALTELHSAAVDMSTAFGIIFECMFKHETLMLYNWFGTNKQRSFRNFGGITDLLLLSAQNHEPKFNMLRLQKILTQHVMGLQRKHKTNAKFTTPFKEDAFDFDKCDEIRYICEEMYPIVVTSNEDEQV